MLPPLTFKPVYQDYIWGGDWIRRRYRPDAPGARIAESWEVSAHPDGPGIVASGPLAGQSLADLMRDQPEAVAGPGLTRFPLLIKVLDAREDLSLQVHPDDDTAARFGGEAKTEMWHILDADEGAKVYCGLLPGVTPASLEAAMREDRPLDVMRAIPVRKGDTIFVPGGRVHAIGAGCRLLEVQQSSNTTYRLNDWGRLGADGKPRELHLEKGLRVVNWQDNRNSRVLPGLIQERTGLRRWVLLETPWFRLEKLEVEGVWVPMERGPYFDILFAARRPLRVENAAGAPVDVPEGTSVLIPAELRPYGVRSPEGTAEFLRVTLPVKA
jgi:mannose-6-phosphate isomerase